MKPDSIVARLRAMLEKYESFSAIAGEDGLALIKATYLGPDGDYIRLVIGAEYVEEQEL